MSTHTPGPWTAVANEWDEDLPEKDREWYILTNKEEAIAFKLSKANARLIAEAPNLLAACKQLVEAVGNPTDLRLGSEQLQRFISAWGDMRRAVAKAEGTS